MLAPPLSLADTTFEGLDTWHILLLDTGDIPQSNRNIISTNSDKQKKGLHRNWTPLVSLKIHLTDSAGARRAVAVRSVQAPASVLFPESWRKTWRADEAERTDSAPDSISGQFLSSIGVECALTHAGMEGLRAKLLPSVPRANLTRFTPRRNGSMQISRVSYGTLEIRSAVT